MSEGPIHDEHPFIPPPDERDRARQLRGRLVSPVTIVTAGGPEARTGLTVSSLMTAEGNPPHVFFLVGEATDFFAAMEETGRFVVHVLGDDDRSTADIFAGLRPSPGGSFAGLDVVDGEYGPELARFGTRAYCRYVGGHHATYHLLAYGEIDRIDIADLSHPLAYFRGGYRSLR